MSECDIGMLTTVLIGNSNTLIRHGLMVTPRGYANKYELHGDGSTRQGERPGRSLSTGLLGWMENLKVDHAEGQSIAALALALRHKLPADYIEAVLLRPTEEVAVKPAVFSCPATWPTTRRTTGRPWQRPAKRAFFTGACSACHRSPSS